MRLKNLDLIGAILFATIDVGWTLLPHRSLVIGIILALPLTFFLPGYALTQTLLHRQSLDPSSNLILRPSLKQSAPVSPVDYITLSLGLSMAIDVLVGFILNVFPIGLHALSWTISLGLITSVFVLLAAYLRRRDWMKIASVNNERMPKYRMTINEYILLGLAIVVAIVAVWSSVLRPSATQSNFTQFWMLPSNQTAISCAVRTGIRNMESRTVKYRVVVTMNGTLIRTWPSITLGPQQEWDQLVSFSPRTAGKIYVEGQLYQSNKPATVYRKVNVTLHSLGNSKNGKALQCGTA